MKRFEEYEALMAELENCAPVELEDTLVRAQKKKMRREKIYRPFIGVAAVKNDYVQPMNLVQMDGEISVKVEYLIVDQKQVNVFYRLYSDV